MTHAPDKKWENSVHYRTELVKEIKKYGVKLSEPHKKTIEELENVLEARKQAEERANPLTVEVYRQYKEQKMNDKRIMMLHGLKQAEFHEWKRTNNLTRKTREGNMTDVTKPSHYHTGNIDVIRFSEENFAPEEIKGFCRMNAIKYITRYDKKDHLNDLKKAAFYLNKLIELEEAK